MPVYITLVCGHCSNSFQVEKGPGRKPGYCGKQCARLAREKMARDNPNQTRDAVCKECRKEFKAQIRSDERRGLFCSKECTNIYSNKHGKYAVESKCLYCGTERKMKSNRLFCDIECKRSWINASPDYSWVEKRCTQCNQDKKLYDFNFITDKNNNISFTSICSNCKSKKSNAKRTPELARSNHLVSRYGITSEEFDEILARQNFRCATCKRTKEEWMNESRKGAPSQWQVDHDHVTGKVRGALCHACNIGIGKFNDDIEVIQNVIDYIKSHRENNT